MNYLTNRCEFCYQEFETEWETKRYCSRSHKERAKQQRKTGRKFSHVYFFSCSTCESTFASRRNNQTYCSKDCRDFVKKQQKRENERVRAIGIKQKLYFRDKGKCQLCFEPIDISLPYPHPQSLSIDHIIPISRGGSSAMYNLQIAHNYCNSVAGAKNAQKHT